MRPAGDSRKGRSVRAGVSLAAVAAATAALLVLGPAALSERLPDGHVLADSVDFYAVMLDVIPSSTAIAVAAVSTLVAGTGLWYVVDPGPEAAGTGAVVGSLAAALAHVLFGPAFLLFSVVRATLRDGVVVGPAGEVTTVGVLDAVVFLVLAPAIASLYAVLLTGWATLPVGALAGWCLVALGGRREGSRADGHSRE